MLRDPYGRPQSLFKTLRQLHCQNVDSAGLNDLTEAFSSFMTRARFFSTSLRRTWSHSAIEFVKYRRRLPALVATDSTDGAGGDESSDEELDSMASTSDAVAKRAAGRVGSSRSTDSCKFDDPKRVFVSNISSRVTSRQLASFFAKFGKVISCTMPSEKGTLGRRSRGIGFITFSTEEAADRAKLAAPEDVTYYGREMDVTSAAPVMNKRHSMPPNAHFARADSETSPNASDCSTLPDSNYVPSSPFTPRSSFNVLFLPEKALIRIFKYLRVKDRIRCERVSKRFMEYSFNSWASFTDLNFDGPRDFGTMFKGSRPLQNPVLKSILHRCGRYLHKLDLSGASMLLDDQSLLLVGVCCPQLKHLNLTGVRVRSWSALKTMAENVTELETLIIRNGHSVGEKGFWWLFRSCKSLRHVDLSGCRRLTGKCFRHLGLTLELAIFDGCTKLEPLGVEYLARQCANMTTVRLNDASNLTNDNLAHICRLNELQVLSLCGRLFPFLTADGLMNIAKLTTLRELYLNLNPALTDTVLVDIAEHCSNLESLAISAAALGHGIGETAIGALASLPKLKEVDVSYLPAINDRSIEAFGGYTLQTLRMRGCSSLTNEGVKKLHSLCPNLWELDLSGCLRITNRGVDVFFDGPAKSAKQTQNASPSSLTLILGGTSCEPRFLKGTRVVLDMSDYSKRRLCPELSMDDHQNEDSDFETGKADYEDDDDFLLLSEQPSFVLDQIEEDSASEDVDFEQEMPVD